MKNFKQFLFILFLFIPCAILFGGCSFRDPVYVTDIKPTEIVGNTTTYTVYYSNGTQSLLTVENGKDGENLTIESIKEYCDENGIDFENFLEKFLTIDNKTETIQQSSAIAIQSAVSVWCEFPVSNFYVKDTSVSCGAGVIYSMNDDYSYILTNYHVVYYSDSDTANNIASKIHIFQYGTSEYAYDTDELTPDGYPKIGYGEGAVEAEFIGGAMNYDIAVLKVATEDLLEFNPNAKAATIADGYNLADTAIAIGNPETLGISVTSGIISVVSEEITMTGADDVSKCNFRVMRIDTAVNGGNSGGGLFNINGELIGIVNAKVIDSQIDNISYALPVDNVTKVANNLIYYYESTNQVASIKKLKLNITHFADNSRSIYNPTTKTTTLKEDIVINSVNYMLSLDKIGLGHTIGLQAGDIVKSISINGVEQTFNMQYEFEEAMLNIRPGDKFVLTVERNNVLRSVGITTEEGVSEDYFVVVK